MNRLSPTKNDRVRQLGALCLSVGLALCVPSGAGGQLATRVDSVPTITTANDRFYPEFQKRREIVLSGVGAGSLVTSFLVRVDYRVVPAQGLDPADIPWSMDRGAVANSSLDAAAASNWTRAAALVFPFVTTLATGGRSGFGRRSVVYAETLSLSMGFTLLGKRTLSRARPYSYRSAAERPDASIFDVSRRRTFLSMPSGHASAAWTGAALGMTDHLLSRPEAGWVERAGVGLLGGALAGATSALRVEGGQHFPTDVMAGAALGIATGVGVPMLHRGERPLPSLEAWLQMIGGALAGTVLGVLVAG